MKLIKKYWVDYSHRLTLHDGKCKNLHGHTAEVVVTFEGKPDATTGMIIDFGKLQWLETIVNRIDHAVVIDINDENLRSFATRDNLARYMVPPLLHPSPLPKQSTAEVICETLAGQIRTEMARLGCFLYLKLHSLSFAENPDSIILWEAASQGLTAAKKE